MSYKEASTRKWIAALATLLLASLLALATGCANPGSNASTSASSSTSASDTSSAAASSETSASNASSATASGEASEASASAPASTAADLSNLVIIHTNDAHGYDKAADGCLGMAAVAQLKADYEAKGNEVLLLDSGDIVQGNILVADSKGSAAIEFMNAVGYDAAALGNHEFDYGADTLESLIQNANFPLLCANITVDETGELFSQPNTVFTLQNGAKVGVFGIDTPETATDSNPKNTAGLSIAKDDDLYAITQQQADELRAQGCALVVCLGHLGEEDRSEPNRASDVVANTSGVDVFIDAHDHEVENVTMQNKEGNDVLVVETGCYLANIGVLTFDKNGTPTEELVAAGSYDGSDQKVADIVDAEQAKVDKTMAQVVGTTAFELSGAREPGVRDHETNLADFVTDAILWQATNFASSAPDAALVNGGGLRTSIEAGDVSLGDIFNVLPFQNQLCTVKVTGADLLEAIEAGTQACPDEMGGFPQVAGITYTLDTTVPYEKGDPYPDSTYCAPANPGARVTITDVNGKGFDLNATYTIATITFIADGGDTYYSFAKAASATSETLGVLDYEAVRNYLTDELGGTVPDKYAEAQGRITVIE